MRYVDPSREVSSNGSPPCSSATAASSPDMELAIQVTSCCSTRLRSAVTSPPPPRLAIRSPDASCVNVTGPRFETTISFRRPPIGRTLAAVRRLGLRGAGRHEVDRARVVARQPVEEGEPVAQEPRHQEVAADVFLAAKRGYARPAGVVENVGAGFRAGGDRVDKKAGLAVLDLVDDAADASCDDRLRLPERLGHREPESLS